MVFELKGVGVREPLLFKQRGEELEKKLIDVSKAIKKNIERDRL